MDSLLDHLLNVTLALFMAGNMLDMGPAAAQGAPRPARPALPRREPDLGLSSCCPRWPGPSARTCCRCSTPTPPGWCCWAWRPARRSCRRWWTARGGDLGYTAAFMLLAVVVIVAYMPLAVPWLAPDLSADAWTIAKPLLLFLLLLLALGLWLRCRSLERAQRLHPVVKKLTNADTWLMLVLCVVVYGEGFLSLLAAR